jgi:hypothetical protein
VGVEGGGQYWVQDYQGGLKCLGFLVVYRESCCTIYFSSTFDEIGHSITVDGILKRWQAHPLIDIDSTRTLGLEEVLTRNTIPIKSIINDCLNINITSTSTPTTVKKTTTPAPQSPSPS